MNNLPLFITGIALGFVMGLCVMGLIWILHNHPDHIGFAMGLGCILTPFVIAFQIKLSRSR